MEDRPIEVDDREPVMQLVTENDERIAVRVPERTCVGCRGEDEKSELLRFAFDGERLVPDVRGRLGRRGVWVHGTKKCLERAVRGGGFSRALRASVQFDLGALVGMLRQGTEQRMASLLLAARRAKRVVVGTDECVTVMRNGGAALLVVAEDARASREAATEAALACGLPVVSYGTKASLGRLFGKEEVGVAVVVDAAMSESISEAAARIAALSEDE